MALRLIEIVLPKDKENKAEDLIKEHNPTGLWFQEMSRDKTLIKVLIKAEEVEPIVVQMDKHFSTLEHFRLMLLSVEATIPRIEEPVKTETVKEEEKNNKKSNRISIEELYLDLEGMTKLSKVYITTVLLSAIVAAIGIMKDNVAVIIGAMVIAPLLGPNVALSLGTTLGDLTLCKNALRAGIVGSIIVLIFSIAIGYFFHLAPVLPELYSRTNVGISDIVLALASGSAGALAFTSGLPSTLVGVMVAVALLPPLVSVGLLFGGGHLIFSYKAFLLFLANLICINLAGVLTFLLQGIKPISWWESKKAKKATTYAILMWSTTLAILLVAILLSKKIS